MPPTQLQIATSSLTRLLKEEESYYTEIETQRSRIADLEAAIKGAKPEPQGEEGNREYSLKQEKKALEESRAVLPTVRERIVSAREKLESVLDTSTDEAELEKAREVLTRAKEAQKEDPDSANPKEVV